MEMKISFAIFFLIGSFSIPTSAQEPICKSVKCSNSGPDITFPFSLNGQPRECGVPGFELICRSNSTAIKLPSYGDLAVKSISYRDKRLDLLDPRSCVHEVFLNLNLSRTQFKYYYSLKSYTYINCSEPAVPLKYSSPEIPCLSGPGYHVYTVESSRASSVVAIGDRSSTCKAVKTVEIPFAYSPYLSDTSFGLRLTWESTDSCGGCTERSHRAAEKFVPKKRELKILRYHGDPTIWISGCHSPMVAHIEMITLGGAERGLSINPITAALTIIMVAVVIMAALVSVKIHNSKKQGEDELMDEQLLHAKKLLDDDKSQTYTTGLV